MRRPDFRIEQDTILTPFLFSCHQMFSGGLINMLYQYLDYETFTSEDVAGILAGTVGH